MYSIHSSYISSPCTVMTWSCHSQSIQELRSCMKRQGFEQIVANYVSRMFGLFLDCWDLLRSKAAICFQNSDSTRFQLVSSLSMFIIRADYWLIALLWCFHHGSTGWFFTHKEYFLKNIWCFHHAFTGCFTMAILSFDDRLKRSWPQRKTSEGHRLQVACVVLRIYGLTSLLAGSSRLWGWFSKMARNGIRNISWMRLANPHKSIIDPHLSSYFDLCIAQICGHPAW